MAIAIVVNVYTNYIIAKIYLLESEVIFFPVKAKKFSNGDKKFMQNHYYHYYTAVPMGTWVNFK